MPQSRVYLDHNATTPLHARARAAMVDALDMPGNPSSVHAEGRAARAAIENARAVVAERCGAQPDGVTFTSGGTEANALVLTSWPGAVAISGIEHDAVRGARPDALVLPIDADGIVEAKALETLPAGTLVSVMSANNETGAIQPIARIADIVRSRGLTLHCDSVQSLGRGQASPLALGAHYVALSGHKMGGPKGVGAVIAAPDSPPITADRRGGGQEGGRRGGTENVAGIVGLAAAVQGQDAVDWSIVARLRDWIEGALLTISPEAKIASSHAPRLPNTLCIAAPGHTSEMLVIAFDLAGIAVSAGAACSSGKVRESHVLSAMGWDATTARSAIRVSLGAQTTQAEAERFVAAWKDIVGQARTGLAA